MQRDNWKELPEIFRFAKKNSMELVSILLLVPSHMSIMTLPDEKRREILDYYLKEVPKNDLIKINTILMPLAESLSKIDRAAYLSYLKETR